MNAEHMAERQGSMKTGKAMPPSLRVEKITGPLQQYKRRQTPADKRKFTPEGLDPDIVDKKTE
jgi:hypothetical protein